MWSRRVSRRWWRGTGSALYDNMGVTVFEGSDFAAEAAKVRKPPTINGTLDDWDRSCPIPLIGRNQLRVVDKNYARTPQNLSGVAYLNWDSQNLYVAVEVARRRPPSRRRRRNRRYGRQRDPGLRPDQSVSRRRRQVVRLLRFVAETGRGSGTHTLYRPSPTAAAEVQGSWLGIRRFTRSSSRRTPRGASTRCASHGASWTAPAFGGKFGFAIQLNDNDGAGLAAHMNWGGGLAPTWRPADFGVMTLVEKP